MTNHEINTRFLSVIDSASRNAILRHIADNYGTHVIDIYEELRTEGAENILDYMTGAERTAARALYLRHGFTL